MSKQLRIPFFGMLLGLLAGILLSTACDISGSNDVVRQVSLNIAGVYTNDGGIASSQSGTPITVLSIQQRGDQLDVVDNLGARWTGSIGRADSNLATFTLNGLTNTGVAVTITGSIAVDGTSASMSGTWIEPNLRSVVSATATVAGVITPTPVPTVEPVATATPIPTT